MSKTTLKRSKKRRSLIRTLKQVGGRKRRPALQPKKLALPVEALEYLVSVSPTPPIFDEASERPPFEPRED